MNTTQGHCECGCGQKTTLAKKTNTQHGHVKGKPLRFVRGHESIKTQGMKGANPSGLCMCGCGLKTNISAITSIKQNIVKGQPCKFIAGHQCIKTHDRVSPNPSGLCMCGCGQPTLISKQTDDSSNRVKGQAMRFIKGHGSFKPLLERFWSKVNKNGPVLSDTKVLALYPEIANTNCWLWTGRLNEDGYGSVSIEGASHGAHRVAWYLEAGEWTEGETCHKCDNPACVRFSHLFDGTHLENIHDCSVKGRKRTVLTVEQVQDIKRVLSQNVWGSLARLAEKYGVVPATISNINTNKVWKHVTV